MRNWQVLLRKRKVKTATGKPSQACAVAPRKPRRNGRCEAGFWVPRFQLCRAKAAPPPLTRAAFLPILRPTPTARPPPLPGLNMASARRRSGAPPSLLGDSLRLLTLALLRSSFHSPQQILGSFRTETKAVTPARLLATADSLRRPPLELFIGSSRFATAVEHVFWGCVGVCVWVYVGVLSETGFLYVTLPE